MPIQLTLDPSLPVSPTDFAAAWNADPRTDDLATAEVSSIAGAETTEGDVILLRTTQTAMPVGAAALYDLIRDVLHRQDVDGAVQIDQYTTPDGNELLTVRPGDEPPSDS